MHCDVIYIQEWNRNHFYQHLRVKKYKFMLVIAHEILNKFSKKFQNSSFGGGGGTLHIDANWIIITFYMAWDCHLDS